LMRLDKAPLHALRSLISPFQTVSFDNTASPRVSLKRLKRSD
jgi:hypothetical protein